jgi:hypothetical protein
MEEATKEADKIKNKAATLSAAIETGELTNQQKQLFSTEELTSWNNAANAVERAALAAKMWKDYTAETAELGEELITTYGNANTFLQGINFKNDDKFSGLNNKDDYIHYLKKIHNATEENVGAIADAWDNLEKKGIDFSELNNFEITEKLKQELIDMGYDVTEATKIAAEMSKDEILKVYSTLGE